MVLVLNDFNVVSFLWLNSASPQSEAASFLGIAFRAISHQPRLGDQYIDLRQKEGAGAARSRVGAASRPPIHVERLWSKVPRARHTKGWCS